MAISYLRSSVNGAESLRAVDDSTRWSVLHERFEFVAIYAGHCVAEYRGRTIDGPRATVCAFEPGNLHRNPHNDATYFQVLILEPALVASLLPEGWRVDRLHFAPICPRVPAQVLALHRRVHQLFDEEAEALELEREIIALLAITAELLAERPLARLVRMSRDDARARRVLSKLDAEFARKLTLDELASDVGCDKFHLLRCFKAMVGIAPHQYVLQKRVSEARRLLARGEPPAAAAQRVGFHDQSHLNRHFSRIVGVAPGGYATGPRRWRGP